ncbi:MAG: hypothetical protein FWD48_03120 [Oscillospiraceae bacterium]|nr:hypothetical protein [Oscillospiraceae bacterium]
MSQKTKRIINITAPIIGLLIIAAISCAFFLNTTADEVGFRKELYGDGALQTGRYYLHGEKDNFYYEVFEDQTIQLGGGDPAEFVLLFNGLTLKDMDSLNESDQYGVKLDAEWRSTRRNYVVTENFWNKEHTTVSIMLDAKTLEDTIGGGHLLRYIDEKTIDASADGTFLFIRID